MNKITLSSVTCHNVSWIPMKNVVTLHGCNCLTSMVHSWSFNHDPSWLQVSLTPSLSFRFDTGGPGSCLKRYSDPTFFRRASASSGEATVERDTKNRKARRSKVCLVIYSPSYIRCLSGSCSLIGSSYNFFWGKNVQHFSTNQKISGSSWG